MTIIEILIWWLGTGFVLGLWGSYNDKEVKTIGDLLFVLGVSSMLGILALMVVWNLTIKPILNFKIRK